MDMLIGTVVHLFLGGRCLPSVVTSVNGSHLELEPHEEIFRPAGIQYFDYEPKLYADYTWHFVLRCHGKVQLPPSTRRARPIRDVHLP